MSEDLLSLLRLVLLIALYGFFAAVMAVVWLQVRADRPTSRPLVAGSVAARRSTSEPGSSPAPAPSDRVETTMIPTEVIVAAPERLRGQVLDLDTPVTVGRASDCRLVLDDDPYVSQHHLRIARHGRHCLLEDLESTNGTFLNGRRVDEPARLAPGDRIALGEAILEMR